jgi:hypothetical protein
MSIGARFGILASSGGVSPLVNTKSIDFDGTDDHLSGSGTFDALDGLEKASFSFWIKPISDATTLRFIFQIGRGSTGLNSQVEMWLYEGNRIQADINASSVFVRGDISSITYGSWNHIALVINGGASTNADKGKIYVNGANESTSNNLSSFSTFPNAADELFIGETKTGHYNPFLGNIDEMAIFVNEELSAAKITTLYNSGVPTNLNGFSPKPTHWWRNGDGDTFPTITDQIGSYNLSMVNMVSGDIEEDVPS